MNSMKFLALFIAVFIFLPIAVSKIPYKQATSSNEIAADAKQLVFATNLSNENQLNANLNNSKVLVYFSHPEEAFKPVTLATAGVQAVSHQESNIKSLRTIIQQYFELNQIKADTLNVDVIEQIKTQGLQYKDSYLVMRPFIKQALENNVYDMAIDFHRDAAPKKVTTISFNEMSYAKIAFVVGSKHDAYEGNYAFAEALQKEINEIVPGISRGILKKGEVGANGIYNQDLARNMLLIELGGIDNTEEELVRTISVIAKAISNLLNSEHY